MNVRFYKTRSDRKKMNKSLSTLATLSCEFKSDSSAVDPIIIVNKSSKLDIKNVNYVYIEDFGRYYFVNNIVADLGHRLEIHCHVDVLYTYRNEIKARTWLIERQEHIFSEYIPDAMLKVRSNRQFNTYTVGSFNAPNGSYFALTANNG